MTTISKKEWAQKKNVHPSRVTQLIKEKKLITTDDGKRIEVELSEALQSARASSPAVLGQTLAAAAKKFVNDIEVVPPGSDGDDGIIVQNTKLTEQILRAQLKLTEGKAAITEIEVQAKKGAYVDADDVRKAGYDMARALRDSLLSIPDRCSAILAAETSPAKVHELLTKEIRTALEDMIQKELSVGG